MPGAEDTPAVVPASEAAPEAPPGEEEAAPPADMVDAALAPAPQPAVRPGGLSPPLPPVPPPPPGAPRRRLVPSLPLSCMHGT